MVDIDVDQKTLIKQVEINPVLWDKTLQNYKSRVATKKAWHDVTNALIPEFQTKDRIVQEHLTKLIIQKWTHIRDNYSRCLKRTKSRKTSKPYIHTKRLRFMDKIIRPLINNRAIYEHRAPKMIVDLAVTDDDSNDSNQDTKANIKTNEPTAKTPKANASHACLPPNRHMSFFQSILPTLEGFDDNEVLEFQVGVLQLLKNLKMNRLPSNVSSTVAASSSYNSQDSFFEVKEEAND